MTNNKFTRVFMFMCLSILWAACSDDEDTPQPITINFTNVEAGISSSSQSAEVGITFSRAATSDGEIALVITSGDLIYGSEADFYTNPEAVDNTITLPYTAGDESVNFTVTAGETLNINEDKTVSIGLEENGDLVVGNNISVVVTFSENFIAPSGSITLDAGGENFTKQAYVDLSKLIQTTADKHSWDLGFYTEAGEYYVQLNAAGKVMARELEQNNLNEVSASDTVGFSTSMTVPNYTNPDAAAWVDTSDGNLTTSAFGEISSTDAENSVFIIKRDGEGRNWKKVRVLRNEDGYTIQYADIAASSFETVEISKDESFNFTFFGLDNGVAEVEPEKASWDIMYSSYTSLFPAGPDLLVVSYNDFLTINRHNTSIALVMEEEVATYENFSSSDLGEVEFSSAIDAQASSWRDPFEGIVFEDRFLLLNDSEGNIFKIQFTDLTSSEGERGYAQFKFERVQ